MPSTLFVQNIIAIIWDFDKTLIPGYMQRPLLDHFSIDESQFWKEVNGLPRAYQERGAVLVSKDNVYLNHILTYVRENKFEGLTNSKLKDLGRELDFYPGLPDFLQLAKDHVKATDRYKRHEIQVEQYIVSTGLRQMIIGSDVADYVDDVWGCEFAEGAPNPGYLDDGQRPLLPPSSPVSEIAYAIDNTTKTRAVFEINKGTNKFPEIDVNSFIAHEDRRVPFQNMIYVADGPSDVPVFSVVKNGGGRTFAVYERGSDEGFKQAKELQNQGRINAFGPADYQEGSHTYMWILTEIEGIAERIVSDRERALGDRTGRPPKHFIVDKPPKKRVAAERGKPSRPAGPAPVPMVPKSHQS